MKLLAGLALTTLLLWAGCSSQQETASDQSTRSEQPNGALSFRGPRREDVDIPGGGGCMRMAARMSDLAGRVQGADLLPFIGAVSLNIATAKVSIPIAREMGMLPIYISAIIYVGTAGDSKLPIHNRPVGLKKMTGRWSVSRWTV